MWVSHLSNHHLISLKSFNKLWEVHISIRNQSFTTFLQIFALVTLQTSPSSHLKNFPQPSTFNLCHLVLPKLSDGLSNIFHFKHLPSEENIAVEAFGDFLFILIKLKGPKTLSIDLPESKKGEIFVFVCIHATSRIIKLMELSSRFLFFPL